MLSTHGSTHDPNAFYSQLEEVQKGERALEEAGQSASHEESLAAGKFPHLSKWKSKADAVQMQARTARSLTRTLTSPPPSQRQGLLSASSTSRR